MLLTWARRRMVLYLPLWPFLLGAFGAFLLKVSWSDGKLGTMLMGAIFAAAPLTLVIGTWLVWEGRVMWGRCAGPVSPHTRCAIVYMPPRHRTPAHHMVLVGEFGAVPRFTRAGADRAATRIEQALGLTSSRYAPPRPSSKPLSSYDLLLCVVLAALIVALFTILGLTMTGRIAW